MDEVPQIVDGARRKVTFSLGLMESSEGFITVADPVAL